MHSTQHPRRTTCAAVLLALLGMAVGVQAQAVPVATQFVESQDGIGHMLVVPYYTVQGGNATLLNITNSDKVNGKAVKLRFRGASNADDVFNFTLFLSPGDVWAAEVSQNPVTGLARLSTPDDSCTLPTNVNRDFSTARLNPAADVANESREGYIDIITMADVVPGTAVHTATTHVDGKLPAPCSQGASAPAALQALQALLSTAGISAAGFSAPTTGLFANWSIFNVADATSWAGAATAIVAVDSQGLSGKGRVVVFPQAAGALENAVGNLTSDPLLRSGAIATQPFDLPDLSTPYLDGITTVQQAAMLSGAIAKASIASEFFTDDSVQAQTDFVYTLPTRRYSFARDYAARTDAFTVLSPEFFYIFNTYRGCTRDVYQTVNDRSGRKFAMGGLIIGGSVEPWDEPFCGAVAVWSVNAGDSEAASALGSSVVRKDVEFPYQDGWSDTQVTSNTGLPVLGFVFSKATSTNIGAGISGNFGLTWPHRYTRPGVGTQ